MPTNQEAEKFGTPQPRATPPTYEDLLDAERRALAYQEFIAYTMDEFGERMPSQWKAHAKAVLSDAV